jgi:hypothetical protein
LCSKENDDEGICSTQGEVRNVYTNLVGKSALKRPLGDIYVTEWQCVSSN